MENNLPADDLNYILGNTEVVWKELKDARLFMTGGTGFFGKWLLESFARANKTFALNASMMVLTRDASRFKNTESITFYEGDVKNFAFPTEKFSHIIHAATEASAKLNEEKPTMMFDTIMKGTQHVLDFARHCEAKKILFVSSGAVYGVQPFEVSHITEDYTGDPAGAYGKGKYSAENLCQQFYAQYGIEVKIARCFAFVGPHLPLDKHFAIGNFIGDGLKGRPIKLTGDGQSYRSYLYASELTIWLWTILCRGESCRPYNVGSDEAVSTLTLAQRVAAHFKGVEVSLLSSSAPSKASRYVPSIERAKNELQLPHKINLDEAIGKTIAWYQNSVIL